MRSQLPLSQTVLALLVELRRSHHNEVNLLAYCHYSLPNTELISAIQLHILQPQYQFSYLVQKQSQVKAPLLYLNQPAIKSTISNTQILYMIIAIFSSHQNLWKEICHKQIFSLNAYELILLDKKAINYRISMRIEST